MGSGNKPVAKIAAKRKDAERGEKAIGILALWPGQYGYRASLDQTVAKIVLTDGTEILPGRDSKHWLNVYVNEPIAKDRTREERQQEKRDEALVDRFGGDDDIPF